MAPGTSASIAPTTYTPRVPSSRAERQRLIWVINAGCPSRCVYCGIASQREKRELDEAEALSAARAVCDAGFREVVFVGGEPLLYPHLPRVLEELRGRVRTAVFSGGLPGSVDRWIETLAHGADRLVLSIDDGDEDRNDLVRGRRGVSRELVELARGARRALPSLEVSISTVVTRHNARTLDSTWERVRSLEPTAWVAVLAGDNFDERPAGHFLDTDSLEQLYFATAPALARRVGREAPDTDFLLFPVPLSLLRLGVSTDGWSRLEGPELAAVRGELADFARGDYNARFVREHGCPLVGCDASIGVDGEVYPCSQAPILQSQWALGSLRDTPLAELLSQERSSQFSRGIPHAPCSRCWAPSNVEPSVLDRLLGRKALS
jgi:radical SAM protein with 4Fe4S-binding SPASM domain